MPTREPALRWRGEHVQFHTYRQSRGLRPKPRAGSAISRLLALFPEAPLLSARSVERLLGVTHPAAKAALEELADAGLLHRKKVCCRCVRCRTDRADAGCGGRPLGGRGGRTPNPAVRGLTA
jgi:hypothetical protein